MTLPLQNENNVWPLWKKILFRFFFIYLILRAAPWMLFNNIPGVYAVTKYYNKFIDRIIRASNAYIFHVSKVLIKTQGTSDASWNWAQFYLYVCIAVAGCIIWSLIEHRKTNYVKLNYWLCLIVRYYLVFLSFYYGFAKIYLQQMPYPSQSQMATPVGDLLPMRLAWVFMGYSKGYETFAGFMEVVVGILLLYRRTTTLGVLLAVAVYSNVVMINLNYDVPVKLFSINILVFCLFLLANELNRILCFFVWNKPAAVCSLYDYSYPKKWMRNAAYILKILFIISAFVIPVLNHGEIRYAYHPPLSSKSNPIRPGFYNVILYKINHDTIPFSPQDSMRWQNVIFENGAQTGSIKTADTIFRQRYRRGYFRFVADTAQHTIMFGKLPTDSAMRTDVVLFMHYQIPNDSIIQLSGKENNDSLFIVLQRTNHHFPLAEKQFHWLSNYNR